QFLNIYSGDQLFYDYADPCRLRKGRAVEVEAEAADFDLETIARGVGEASEREVANALDRDTGEDAQYGEEDECGEVYKHYKCQKERRIKERHDRVAVRESGGGRTRRETCNLPGVCQLEHSIVGVGFW